MLKKIIIPALLFTISLFAAAPTVAEILKKIESNEELKSDAKAKVSVTQQKVNQGVKQLQMVWQRRDKDNAFLIVMQAPESDKGNGYLRVGDNMWMYRKNTRTFQHINRDESIGGSDAKADDFENKKLTEMYGANGRLTEEMLGKIAVYRFELKAIDKDVDYPKKIFWVRKDNFLRLKEESYSLSGTLMETAYYLKYTTVDGKYIAVKFMINDEFEKGNKSIIEISDISTAKIDDAVFTKPYLENLSK